MLKHVLACKSALVVCVGVTIKLKRCFEKQQGKKQAQVIWI